MAPSDRPTTNTQRFVIQNPGTRARSIHAKSFVTAKRSILQSPVEYEYRYAEYEYDEDRTALMP